MLAMDICHLSSGPMTAPVAQLVRASDQHSKDPGSNPGWISISTQYHAGSPCMLYCKNYLVKVTSLSGYSNFGVI